jgi:glutathione S-transferase
MKLFYSPTSPYARKCRALAIEKGIEGRLEIITASPMSNPPELQAANPLGKVPALVLDNGQCIVDSPVICAWLDSLSDTPRLFPADPAARIDALTREALADGIMDAAFAIVMERKRPDQQRSPEWLMRWTSAIRRSVAHFSTLIPKREQPDIGDLSLACALAYVDFRLGDLAWDAEAPALRAWLSSVCARPSLSATAPPPGA